MPNCTSSDHDGSKRFLHPANRRRAAAIGLFLSLIASTALIGCVDPREIVNEGLPCRTDAECKSAIDSRYTCDPITNSCVCAVCFGDIDDSDANNERENNSENLCTACITDADCAAKGLVGYTCNSDVLCCIASQTDGDDDTTDNTSKAFIQCPSLVDFGAAVMDTPVPKNVSCHNLGTEPLRIYSVFYSSQQTPEYAISNLPECLTTTPMYCDVAPYGVLSFTVTYEPKNPGIDNAEILVISNAYNDPQASIALQSQYKGDAELCVACYCENPTAADCLCRYNWDEDSMILDFGTSNVGDGAGIPATFKIWNCGDASGNYILQIEDLSMVDSDPGYSATPSVRFSPRQPLQLSPMGIIEPTSPGDYLLVEALYAPVSAMESGQYAQTGHMEIQYQNHLPTVQYAAVHFTGVAKNLTLECIPSPVRFSTTEYGKSSEVQVLFFNRSLSPMLLHNVDVVYRPTDPTPRESFAVSVVSEAMIQAGVRVEPNRPTEDTVAVGYTPTEALDRNGEPTLRDDTGLLRVQWCNTNVENCYPQQEGENDNVYLQRISRVTNSTYCNMKASGKPPNKPPVARISTIPHGAQSTAPINGYKCGDELNLYGDISYDPDNKYVELAGYRWNFRKKPDDSEAKFRGENYYQTDSSKWINVVVSLDVGGTYEIELDVVDKDGTWNENIDNWVEVNVTCQQALGMIFEYDDCSNKCNATLYYKAPGRNCSENNSNSYGTCIWGAYGNPSVTESSPYCHMGTREQIVHLDAVDGNYEICAKLEEECDNLGFDIFNFPICILKCDPNFTIYLYDPLANTLTWMSILTGRLTSQGESVCWRIQRKEGKWVLPPTPE